MRNLSKFLMEHPRLYHLSSQVAWESIRIKGLLCTKDILDNVGISSDEQRRLVYEARRKGSYKIPSSDKAEFILRDQKPLCWSGLNTALQGAMEPLEWIDLLNDRVFFWIRRKDAMNLAQAASYRHEHKTLLEFDSKSLFEAYRSRITVTTFNVGYTMREPKARSLESFQSIDSFEGASGKIRELTVRGSVKDAAKHIRRVVTIRPDGSSVELLATP